MASFSVKHQMTVSLDDFITGSTCGGFLDGDGVGYYANDNHISDDRARPSDFVKGNVDTKWPYVVWFTN